MIISSTKTSCKPPHGIGTNIKFGHQHQTVGFRRKSKTHGCKSQVLVVIEFNSNSCNYINTQLSICIYIYPPPNMPCFYYTDKTLIPIETLVGITKSRNAEIPKIWALARFKKMAKSELLQNYANYHWIWYQL
jgi:hypothetical protein